MEEFDVPPMPPAVVIPARFNGPRTSANGGWTAGSLARHFGGATVSVALRAPIPLDLQLPALWRTDGSLELQHLGSLLAEAALAELVLELPEMPHVDAAEAAGVLGRMRSSQRGANWPYAHCFACGYDRDDGLRIIPGPVGDEGLVASTWVPDASVCDDQGLVLTEATWAALDCPAGIAWSHRLPAGAVMVTVRMTVAIDRPLRAGQRYRVVGWPISQDGRKLHAGTAIVDDAGEVCARSRQLWLVSRASLD